MMKLAEFVERFVKELEGYAQQKANGDASILLNAREELRQKAVDIYDSIVDNGGTIDEKDFTEIIAEEKELLDLD